MTTDIILSEIYQKDAKAVIFKFDWLVSALTWFNRDLLVGTSDGKLKILSPVEMEANYSLTSELQREHIFEVSDIQLGQYSSVDFVRATGKYTLVGSAQDAPVLLIGEGTTQRFGSEGVTAVDLTDDGVVAVTGDFKRVRVYNGVKYCDVRLENVGLGVKFATIFGRDCLLVVEAGGIIRVLDWKKLEWLATVYTVAYDLSSSANFVGEFFVSEEFLVVIGTTGGLAKYDLSGLKGGAGYSEPDQKGSLNGFSTVKSQAVVVARRGSVVYHVTSGGVKYFDLSSVLRNARLNDNSTTVVDFSQRKLRLPSVEVGNVAVNNSGVVAVNCGEKLVLIAE